MDKKQRELNIMSDKVTEHVTEHLFHHLIVIKTMAPDTELAVALSCINTGTMLAMLALHRKVGGTPDSFVAAQRAAIETIEAHLKLQGAEANGRH